MLGLSLIIVGVIGVWAAVIMEIKTHADLWEILMKVFPTFFGVGTFLYSIGR
ncbi:MAG: hypothetical protein FHOMOCKG_00077 [Methanophagales virus GBV302]|uniref:Uncharacterized protein n=1 Tax=Methanophagales virus GBV302 TaxID=2999281 RepID=A0A9E8V8Y8_9CAUD|nr:MAG: hypothetical protein QIT37_gp077 [Methanophagales virus GBV302]WAE39605.1 MAG: hypothetical protein FHOMOCKG_00077 [Methanophagales virus GBV302]